MRPARRFLFGAAIAFACPAAAQDQEFHSVWHGIGTQDNGELWTIELVLYKDGRAEIDYPTSDCGGRLEPLAADATGATRFREALTYGVPGCIDGGIVAIGEPSGDRRDYTWFYPEDYPGAPPTGQPGANAILQLFR
ncbi:hypothetical protein HKCCE2091_01705 [Rhodobacterales bacterium HKCCE2091]|nr:hypothetical protein [Rhodobacterales bacterium HKCCE2091]